MENGQGEKRATELGQALSSFQKTSNEELKKLTLSEGLPVHDAINVLVQKIQNNRSDTSFEAEEEDIKLVMELSGFNKINATRTLIVRQELLKLKEKGFKAAQAVDDLTRRMKALSGLKRAINKESKDLEENGENKLEILEEWEVDCSYKKRKLSKSKEPMVFGSVSLLHTTIEPTTVVKGAKKRHALNPCEKIPNQKKFKQGIIFLGK